MNLDLLEQLDLDINNYSFIDILNLFNIDIHYQENDIHIIKKKIMKLHPDKSGLDKKFFLFYCKIFKILVYILNYKNNKNYYSNKSFTELLDYYHNNYYNNNTDNYHNNTNFINNIQILENIKPEEFNHKFNLIFEEFKKNELILFNNDNNGYNDWLKQTNIHSENIDDKKLRLRNSQLSKFNDISEFNNNTNNCNFIHSKPSSYSSDLFSNLKFDDLKIAYEESVVPVIDLDNHKTYISIEQLNKERIQQNNIIPMSSTDSNIYFNKLNHQNIEYTSNHLFNLLKQEEHISNINNKFWNSFKSIL